MITVGEAISRVRGNVKSVKTDAFLTDRRIFSMMMKYARVLIRRQDSENKMMMFKTPFQTLCLNLIEVDKAEVKCKCHDIKSGCKFKRTVTKIPLLFDGYWGPLIRTVSSIDGTEEIHPTYRQTWEKISSNKNFKYNKTKYYWYQEGYLYFPNIEWDTVQIEGLFEEDITDITEDCVADACKSKQSKIYTVPTGLHEEIERFVLQELGLSTQLPPDQHHDNKHIIK